MKLCIVNIMLVVVCIYCKHKINSIVLFTISDAPNFDFTRCNEFNAKHSNDMYATIR